MFHYDFHSDFTARDRDLVQRCWNIDSGNDWSAQVQDACFSTAEQPTEPSGKFPRVLLGAALVMVTLLGSSLYLGAPKIAESLEEAAKESVEGLAWVEFILDSGRS